MKGSSLKDVLTRAINVKQEEQEAFDYLERAMPLIGGRGTGSAIRALQIAAKRLILAAERGGESNKYFREIKYYSFLFFPFRFMMIRVRVCHRNSKYRA